MARRLAGAALAVLVATLGVAACGGNDGDEITVPDLDVELDEEAGTIRIEDEVFPVGECPVLPEDFPADEVPILDLPVLAGVEPVLCTRADAGTTVTWSVQYPVAGALGALRDALVDAGFVPDLDESVADEALSFTASRDDLQVIAGAVGDDDGEALLTVTIVRTT